MQFGWEISAVLEILWYLHAIGQQRVTTADRNLICIRTHFCNMLTGCLDATYTKWLNIFQFHFATENCIFTSSLDSRSSLI
jgi:hypothetical protein